MIQPKPPKFEDNIFSFSFLVDAKPEQVWGWLNDTRTFTDTQVWPWKVEFYSPDENQMGNGFYEGVLTNHHGPFINLAGELVSVKKNKYRDLQYNYGSYALSFRWIRPYRLQFETEENEGQTKVTGTLSSYVKPGITGFWTASQKFFWSRFKKWATRSISKTR